MLAVLAMLFVPVLAEAGPSVRPGDSLPPPSPGYTYSPAEIDAARAELALVKQDLIAMLDGVHGHALRQLGSDFPGMLAQFDQLTLEGKLEIEAAWRSFDTMPDQQVPVIAYTTQGFTRRLEVARRTMTAVEPWGSPLVSSARRESAAPMSAGPSSGLVEGPLAASLVGDRSLALACPNDAVFTCGADEVDETTCFLRDVGACIDVCEQITSFLSISSESTPVDIHVVAAGFGINVPSPFKIGIEIVKAVAKLVCNGLECAAENTDIGECTQTQTLDLLKQEKRFTDDEELAAQTTELENKIEAGNTNLVADITDVIATELNKEERFTSDQELTQMEGTLLNEISSLRELSCRLEKMMFAQLGRHYRPSEVCVASAASLVAAGGKAALRAPAGGTEAVGRPAAAPRTIPPLADGPAGPANGSQGGRLLQTLWIETALLDGRSIPSLYLPSEKGGGIEQVQELVWGAIGAQEDLGIAAEQTPVARRFAAEADALLVKREFVAAYKAYSSAYRSLAGPREPESRR